MVGPKGLKRRLSVVLQEQEDLLENSEIILDQEPLSDYASRVPNDQGELRKRQRVSVLKQPELNANIFRFDHIPQDELSFNPAADSLPPDRLAPPSNPTAKPVFPDRILPLPVPTGSRRYDPFTAATNAPSRPSPSPYSLGVPPPRTGLSQPPRPHPYPSNMVPATSKIEGSHRTPSRTPPPTTHVVPQYTYANMQAPTAQATWLGSVLQSPDLSIRQPRPRAVSMPYVLSYRSSSSAESQAVGAVADADAQPLTPQNADPTFPRAQSSSPLQNAGSHRQRAQSSPLSIRGGVLWTTAQTPYQNGQPPVQNTPLPFQNGQPYHQNGYLQSAQPYSQNGYVKNGQPSYQNAQPHCQNGYVQNAQHCSQNGYVQNCYAQPYDHNRLALFQNYPTPFPNYLSFNNNQLRSHQNGVPASIPHFESGSGVASQPSIPSAQPAHGGPSAGNNPGFLPFSHSRGVAAPQASRSPSSGGHSSPSRRSHSPPPAPRLPYREPIPPSSPVPVVPAVLGWLSKQEQLYYASGGKPAVAPTPVEDKSLTTLSNLFEKYRGSDDEKDSISVDGTMAYLTDLAVNLEDASSLISLEIVQAPAIGEMTRDGFVKGWQKAGADSRSTLDTIPKQKAYIASQTKLLSSDTTLFKRVYKHTFVSSKERSQKALPLENALVYWEMLFSSPGMCWASAMTDWLKLWLEFLNAKWTKTVNKDMWNQTLEFFTKSREDETMSFWSEEGAWPSVIDDFVVWVREKRGGGAVTDNMETD